MALVEKETRITRYSTREYHSRLQIPSPDGKLRTTDSSAIRELLRGAMTDQINDREIFMKGIDYSYYYEEQS